MINFNYNLPVNLIFGRNKSDLIGSECKKYGKKVLIVTGTGSTKRTGLLDKAVNLIKAEGLDCTIFDKVTPNPLTTTVYEGVKIYEENGCDVILGLGGGSIMDCAKGISFAVINKGDISDYIFGKKQGTSSAPLVLVPTTCGTGSEGNQIAVLTNPENGDKKGLYTNIIMANSSIIDPLLMKTMPKSVLASVGFDAFTHCLESYTAKKASPITRTLAKDGMTLIAESLPALIEGEYTDDGFDKMSLAAVYGGMVIGASGVCAGHAMEHPVSGLKNVVHGKGLAALTPVITDKLSEYDKEDYTVISKILGGKDYTDCGDSIRNFLKRINLSVTLTDLGIEKSDIPWLVSNCMKVSFGNLQNTCKMLDETELAEIYEKAL